MLQELREDGALTGWRSESYPVLTSFHSEPLALVERAAAVHLGIKAYGVHVNGYVRSPSGIELWVATRSKDKPTWPGRLDHIVAGGQVHFQRLFWAFSMLGILTSGRHKAPAEIRCCIASFGVAHAVARIRKLVQFRRGITGGTQLDG